MFLTETRVQVTRRLSTAHYFYLWCHVVMLREPSHSLYWRLERELCGKRTRIHAYAITPNGWAGKLVTLARTEINPDIQHISIFNMTVWQPPCRRDFVVMWQEIDFRLSLRSNEVPLIYICLCVFVENDVNSSISNNSTRFKLDYNLFLLFVIFNSLICHWSTYKDSFNAKVALLNKTPNLTLIWLCFPLGWADQM